MLGIEPVYKVGGCVRDIVMGLEPHDYDYTTPMLPDDMEAILRAQNKRVYIVGKRFGTIGFKHEGQIVEITTFRQEQYTKGSRKPDVAFVSNIKDDLARRDFTINAMAQEEGSTTIIDPFGGQQDIRDRVIRTVGNPNSRFREDPLRLLRAIRFATVLDFGIELPTWAMMQEKAHRILSVSKERWMMELDKIMISEYNWKGFQLLAESRLLSFMIPELSLQIGYDQRNPHHTKTLWEHTLAALRLYTEAHPHTDDEETLCHRYALLFHDIGKPFVRLDKPDKASYIKHDLLGADMVATIADKLKWSKARKLAVVTLVADHMREDSILREYDHSAK